MTIYRSTVDTPGQITWQTPRERAGFTGSGPTYLARDIVAAVLLLYRLR
jgi:hypothetical protein